MPGKGRIDGKVLALVAFDGFLFSLIKAMGWSFENTTLITPFMDGIVPSIAW